MGSRPLNNELETQYSNTGQQYVTGSISLSANELYLSSLGVYLSDLAALKTDYGKYIAPGASPELLKPNPSSDIQIVNYTRDPYVYGIFPIHSNDEINIIAQHSTTILKEQMHRSLVSLKTPLTYGTSQISKVCAKAIEVIITGTKGRIRTNSNFIMAQYEGKAIKVDRRGINYFVDVEDVGTEDDPLRKALIIENLSVDHITVGLNNLFDSTPVEDLEAAKVSGVLTAKNVSNEGVLLSQQKQVMALPDQKFLVVAFRNISRTPLRTGENLNILEIRQGNYVQAGCIMCNVGSVCFWGIDSNGNPAFLVAPSGQVLEVDPTLVATQGECRR